MPHSPEAKKRVLTRVRRIKGQCEALERALLVLERARQRSDALELGQVR